MAWSHDVPLQGLGCARLGGASGERAIRGALAAGVRHFDTAKVYGNEALLGRILREAIRDGSLLEDDNERDEQDGDAGSGEDAPGGSPKRRLQEAKERRGRERLFVTSKVWNDDHRPSDVIAACIASLDRLQVRRQ